MRIAAPISIHPESFLLFLLILMASSLFSAATDTLNTSQSIRDGETLVSSDGVFEFGFFSPGNSKNRYLGMWHKNIPLRTYVWVANREAPVTNTTGVILRVVEPGRLALFNETNGIIWSSNTSMSVRNPVAQLLDSGNLVVREANDERPENFIWQSFEHPTDSYWSSMKIGWNLVTGQETKIRSWRNEDDPAPGDYTWGMDLTGFPQIFLKRDDVVVYRTGYWNGFRFIGIRDDSTYRLSFVMNTNEVYYTAIVNTSIISKFTMNQSGIAQRLTWVDQRGWVAYLSVPADMCDSYGLCRANGRCDPGNSPTCSCLERFVPRDPNGWLRADWSQGCIRRSNLSCEGDVFLKYSGIKTPDTRNSRYNTNMTLEECKVECLRDCSCMAYAQLDINRGIGCLMWYGNLTDIRTLSAQGQDIFIRMASSEADSKGKKGRILIAVLTALLGMTLLGLGLILFIQKKMKKMQIPREAVLEHQNSQTDDLELPTFDLSTITKATNSFAVNAKLGEGGFGSVYKGQLENGKQIAVKRLSRTSMQGLDEFKNEVICIVKLQHRNLVKLLGCCIQGEEKMLIYEYMPNRSLDLILFDKTKGRMLDWPKRNHIINGIARGLMYLHQDSRLRIIHRDLKASNILLDFDMIPKISDFGMARIFGGNETEGNTSRVVGTYGYMSPEYAVDGLFSIKSDVYSFGVLVLEIVSGKRNRGFQHKDHHHNLLGHAWIQYKEGRALEMVDANLSGSLNMSEILRSIHVALLCVQQHPEDRPNMSQVVYMLGGESSLPQAKQPGFFTERDVSAPESSTNTVAADSSNNITITLLDPR